MLISTRMWEGGGGMALLKGVVAKVESLLAQLSIDSATKTCLLPSVGIKKSKRIVEICSSKEGSALKLADLSSVHGIGAATLSRITGGDRKALARVMDYSNYYRSHYQQQVCS